MPPLGSPPLWTCTQTSASRHGRAHRPVLPGRRQRWHEGMLCTKRIKRIRITGRAVSGAHINNAAGQCAQLLSCFRHNAASKHRAIWLRSTRVFCRHQRTPHHPGHQQVVCQAHKGCTAGRASPSPWVRGRGWRWGDKAYKLAARPSLQLSSVAARSRCRARLSPFALRAILSRDRKGRSSHNAAQERRRGPRPRQDRGRPLRSLEATMPRGRCPSGLRDGGGGMGWGTPRPGAARRWPGCAISGVAVVWAAAPFGKVSVQKHCELE
jgi:hypothetical protein